MSHTRRPFVIWAGHLTAVAMLLGCAQQRIRDESIAQLREGRFEQAIDTLKKGVEEYPESVTLRAGLASTRGEVVARLVAQVTQLKSAGQFDAAETGLRRALALEPANDRLIALQFDLAQERRTRARLQEAEKLVAEGKSEQALRVIEIALRDMPRQPDLMSAQRRLEAEFRLRGKPAARTGLAEERPVTLDFRGAPLSVVLEALTRNSGVNFIVDRDVKLDARVTIYARSIRLDDALDLLAGAQQLSRRNFDAQTILVYPNTPEKHREHQEQVIRTFQLANADAKSIASLLRTILKLKEPFVDERSNSVVIRESPELVAVAERLVALHDAGDAEVMLEVEILEIKTSRLTELGINFPSTFSLTPLPPNGANGFTLDSIRDINSSRIGVGLSGLLVNLRREIGDFNVLANPRIRTKNKEKARILIGDRVPVITSTTNATGFVAETVNYLDVGLKLDVEPVISPDDDVTIKLALEVSSLTKEVRTAAGSLAYQIGTRNANTTLRLRDGETQLLAGIISSEDRSTANRVPGLGDLPLAGRLFSSQRDDTQRTELVLAITPRVVRTSLRPDLAQSELWVGSELATRWRPGPDRLAAVVAVGSPALLAGSAVTGGEARPSKPGDGSPGQTIAKWVAPAEAKSGEVFSVALEIQTQALVRSIPLEIAYPADAFDVLEVQEGEFLGRDGAPTSFTYAVNQERGRIGANVQRNETGGIAGRGSVLRLKLKAKKAGSANLAVTSMKPLGDGAAVSLPEPAALQLTVK